ncbi:unnamed protein product, partial [Brenthis ino]
MNKTVILIQLIISSSLPNPIDEILISRDVGDSKITEPETLLKIDTKKTPVLLNVDDIITSSEVNQKNKIHSGIRRLKESEEQEDTVIEDLKFISSKPNINSSESKQNEEVNPVPKLSQQFKLENVAKTEDVVQAKVNNIESTTTNFEVNGRSGDDLEESTDIPIEFNLSKNGEEEFESNLANDEYNSEWDLFDDTISTRRMLKNFKDLTEETKETTFMEDENINSVPNLNVPENNSRRTSGVVKEQDEGKRGKEEENSVKQTSAINKEKENKNKHLESIQNYNVETDNERRASDITKEEKQLAESIRISNLDHGPNFDKKYDSKNTEVPVIQRIPFIYPSPSELQLYNNPAIPIYPFKSENYNNYKINRISPVTRRQDFEDYSSKSYYRKHLYTPVVLEQKSMTTNIISKLAEASENSYKFEAGKEYFNKFKPFSSFHNVNKNMYVPRY